MSKQVLSEKQMLAVLATNYQEMKHIFNDLRVASKIKDDVECRKAILNNLKYLLEKGFNLDPENNDIYSIFDIK